MHTEAAVRVTAVRRFNRFYTRQIGLLRHGLLGTAFSLTEGRVLYELAQCETTTAAELAADLSIDPGYLSRLLRGFTTSGLVASTRSAIDRRQSILALTDRGREAFASLDRRSQEEIGALLERLDDDGQRRLLAHCIKFARDAGYRKITLWTQSVLTDARHIYEGAGFVLMEEKPHRSFGVDLVGETWELTL